MHRPKQMSLAEKIVQGKYESVREEKAAEKAAAQTTATKRKQAAQTATQGGTQNLGAATAKDQPAPPQTADTNQGKRASANRGGGATAGRPTRQGKAAVPLSEPIESGPKDAGNKTAEEVFQGLPLNDMGRRDGFSDNMPFQSNISDNLVGDEDNSPRFHPQQEGATKNDESISLTQYYLKGSAQERKAAQTEQDEFMRTLNQMEREDVPAQLIDEYKKSEILRKSMAVVRSHAKKMEQIRSSPERYDRVKGKIKTKNPFAANLSSVAGSKRSNMNSMLGGGRAMGEAGTHRNDVPSPIKEETGRALSHGRKPFNQQTDETQDWYRPELGNIPYAPLTKANREKIEARDREIAQKEAELEQIMAQIGQRKQQRAEKEAAFKAQDIALKKKRKAAKKAAAKANGEADQDQEEAPQPVQMDEPLDEEGQLKKDAVLEALQQIRTADFTELKTARAPVALVQQIIQFTGELLLGPPCDFRRGLQELISKPKVFIELSLGLEDRLEASHLKVLRDFRKAQIDLDQVKKISSAAFGLALWLTALTEFSHHSGLMHKAKFVPIKKQQQQHQSIWKYTTNAEQVNDDISRMPKWARASNQDDSLQQRVKRREEIADHDYEVDLGTDQYQQQIIEPKVPDEHTIALMQQIDYAMSRITKQSLHEIKNFPNPPPGVDQVVITLADFVEAQPGHTWSQAKGKLFEQLKRGVGTREKVTEGQLQTLRTFAATGITHDTVRPKSQAAAYLASYLHAVIALQEYFAAQPEEVSEAFWQPDQRAGEEAVDEEKSKPPFYSTQLQGSLTKRRKEELNDIYLQGRDGNQRQSRRRQSAGYLQTTATSRRKTKVDDEMERKIARDASGERKVDAAAADSDEMEELGIDGKPKHRFYNEELEVKTKAIQDQFAELYRQLEVQRQGIDPEAFYEAIDELNYGGITKFEVSPTKRLVKHHQHTVEQKEKFKSEHQRPTQKGNQYSIYSKSYIVEPADGKGLNYKLIDKKPLKFYDQVLTQDVIKKKVYKESEDVLQEAALQAQPAALAHHNSSKMSRKMKDVPLQYQESIGKRGVGILVDECRRHIDEQNNRRSLSPFRDAVEIAASNGLDPGSISARNFVAADPSGTLLLQVPVVEGTTAGQGGLVEHLQRERQTTRAQNSAQDPRASPPKKAVKRVTRKAR